MTAVEADRSARTLILRYAKVVTPEFTYIKHGVQATEGGTVYVTDPRTRQVVATLTDTPVERLPGLTYRAGDWTITDMGCGCRDRVGIEPTPPS